MGYRLSKIYTRTGDKGSTGLGDGSRIDKDSMRMEAIGTVDELNSCIGMLRARLNSDRQLEELLSRLQHQLFDIGGSLAMPGHEPVISKTAVAELEQDIDRYNAVLPPLKNFILPAGNDATSRCHLARTVCRRAERRLVTLSKAEALPEIILAYINRLSDLLFVLCRVIARADGQSEVLWQQQPLKP